MLYRVGSQYRNVIRIDDNHPGALEAAMEELVSLFLSTLISCTNFACL